MNRRIHIARFLRLAILSLGLLMFFSAEAQISPGDLSDAHSQLEGMSNCKKCHDLGKKVSSEKCLDCHTEIRRFISLNKGYHASTAVKAKECFACHNEHHGRKFKITVFDPDEFNHKETGYDLVGKHKENKCTDCHKKEFVKEPISQKTGSEISYIGLSKDCLSCHKDYHEKTLPINCLDCHDMNGFKPAPGFNHDQSKYPLTGAHTSVSCIKCHPKSDRDGTSYQKFKNVAYAKCTDCHEDKHKGKFGLDCLKCHNNLNFKTIKNLTGFNHEQTDYPLQGKHITVDCNECHKGSYTKKVKFAQCKDCHIDYHKGDFVQNGKTVDCVECHLIEGFSPSVYTIEKHNKTKFQLTGGHLATPCISCHHRKEEWHFRELGTRCINCHDDNHLGQIAAKFMPEKNCTSCHTTETWKTVTFDHAKTEFALRGKHATQTCRDCHYRQSREFVIQKFKDLETACLECHEDQHQAQFTENNGQTCTSCHTDLNWKPDLFDHTKTRFPLDGQHKKVDCIKCHKPFSAGDKTYFQYKIKDISCASCHS